MKHSYIAGILYKVQQIDSSGTLGTVYWQAEAANARGQIWQERLGNQLVTVRDHNPVTGAVRAISTGSGSNSGVQNLELTWDLAGNLMRRQDWLAGDGTTGEGHVETSATTRCIG